MATNLFVPPVESGVSAVFTYSTFHSATSLPNILFPTRGAGNEIYDIVGLASQMFADGKRFSSRRAGESGGVSSMSKRDYPYIRVCSSFVVAGFTTKATTRKGTSKRRSELGKSGSDKDVFQVGTSTVGHNGWVRDSSPTLSGRMENRKMTLNDLGNCRERWMISDNQRDTIKTTFTATSRFKGVRPWYR